MEQRLIELAHDCFDTVEYRTHPDRNNFKYAQLEDGTILCVHQTGGGQFRCRVADPKQLQLETLVDHMEDVYATTRFDAPLAPPYSLEEVENFERENQTTLPALLKHYLLKISRETVCDSYRTTIDISTRGILSNRVVTPDDERNGWISEELDGVLDGVLDFSHVGSFMSYVVVKGDGRGCVLSFDDMNSGYTIGPLWKRLLTPLYWSIKRA